MLVLRHQLPIRLELLRAVAPHAVLVELPLPPRPDLRHALHRRQRLGDQLAVVAHGDVAALGELERAVDRHFLAVRAAEGFRPGEFAGVALHLELGEREGRWCQYDLSVAGLGKSRGV